MRIPASLARRRGKAARDAHGPLAAYYQATMPSDSARAGDLPLLAVDLECTSLDLRHAAILSIGIVAVDGARLDLGSSRHMVVNAGRDVGPNVTVHGLTDDAVAAGMPVPEAVEHVLQACAGRVLVAHHARIETTLLSRACAEFFGAPFHPPVIDTMAVERHLVGGGATHPDSEPLDLPSARERYGLPRYRLHEAQTDAIACAELFLAQMTRWPADRPPKLGDLRER